MFVCQKMVSIASAIVAGWNAKVVKIVLSAVLKCFTILTCYIY